MNWNIVSLAFSYTSYENQCYEPTWLWQPACRGRSEHIGYNS